MQPGWGENRQRRNYFYVFGIGAERDGDAEYAISTNGLGSRRSVDD